MDKDFYKQLIENSPVGYAYHQIICDSHDVPCDYVFIEVNQEFEKLTGLLATEIVGRRVTDVIPDIENQTFNWIEYYGNIAINGGKGEFEQFAEMLNKWYRVNVLSPKKGFFITYFLDITQEKKQLEELRESEMQYRLLAENTADVIWVMNMKTMKYVYISPSIFQLRGYTVEEALEQDFRESMTVDSANYLFEVERETNSLEHFIKDPDNATVQIHEIQQPCKNGEVIWVETSTKFRMNAQNEIECVGTSRNIEARKQIENKVLFLSYRDQLTGLYNRRFIEEEIKRLDTPRNLPISVILGDIDKLKFVNDEYGHEKGDALIMIVAEMIQTSCRTDDLVSRWGGDEFVILLPKTNRAEAEIIAERILGKCESQYISETQVSISIGIGTKEIIDESIYATIRHADDAMYQVKAAKKATI